MTTQAVFIDPSTDHFLGDRLFDLNNQYLNRDGTLIPFERLRQHLAKQGIPIHTADKLRDGSERRELNHYWSLGLVDGYESLIGDDSVRMRGFILLEPPLVQPEMYAALPRLTTHFEEVFLHNIVGDGYSLKGVLRERLRKLNWPQPYGDVLNEYWNRDQRLNKLVVIAGNHNPGRRKPELYSERIKAIAALSDCNGVDLFGRGWERWWSRQSFWWPYWRYRRGIMSSYRGSCASKWETLSKYRFSLCFENMPMSGYLTEKLFDCFYAGTVPVYWGAPDIETLVPLGAFVDMRKFSNYQEMLDQLLAMSDEEWHVMREVASDFLRARGATEYQDSLLNVVRI
jgi:alpha(1,3/1,4) fucosyltransferase